MYEKEFYAVVQALKHWRHYLLPCDFVMYSDHEALKYIQSQAKMRSKHAKWIEELQEFSFVLKHKPGVENKAADTLSRKVALLHSMSVSVTSFERLSEAYATCPDFEEIYKMLSGNPLHST